MKPAINQWAFPGDMPTADALSLAKTIGFESFEVCVGVNGPVPLEVSKADVLAIRRHASKIGIELSSIGCGLGWEYAMTSPKPEIREQGKEALLKVLRIAQWIGVECVLTVPGGVAPDTPYDVALENALASIQDIVPSAEKLKVCIAIENVWNKMLFSPVEMRDFIDQFESEYVGAFFDIGNVVWFGYPEQWIRILGKRIRMIHAKDFRGASGNMDGFVMLMEGDVNWPDVVAALREVGYDKALVAEYGPYRHSLDTMLKHVLASLNTIIAL